jgi:hypothetical protein
MIASFQYHLDGVGEVPSCKNSPSETEHIYSSIYDMASSIHSFLKELRADKSIDDGAKMFIQANILSFQEKEALFDNCPTTDKNYVSYSNSFIDGSILNLQYIYSFVSDSLLSDSEAIDRIAFLLNISKSYYYVFHSNFSWELDFYVPVGAINKFFKKKSSKLAFNNNFMYSLDKYPTIVSKTTCPMIPMSFIKEVCHEVLWNPSYYENAFLWESVGANNDHVAVLNYIDISKSFKKATSHLYDVFTSEQKNVILSSDPQKNEVKIPTKSGFGIYYKDSNVWVPDAF